MFFRLNVSVDAAKIAISVTPAAMRAIEARRGSARARCSACPGARVMPANTSAASAICGTHFGLTNAETSMTGRSRGAQPVDERDLVGRRDRRRARSAGRRAVRPRRSVTRAGVMRTPRSVASACTSSPSRQRTADDDAVAGARSGSSIFIASSTTTMSPFFTASPGLTCTLTTVAGIGAVSDCVPRAACDARGRAARRTRARSRRPASPAARDVRGRLHGSSHRRRRAAIAASLRIGSDLTAGLDGSTADVDRADGWRPSTRRRRAPRPRGRGTPVSIAPVAERG